MDCCWNENAKSGKDTASLETSITPAVSKKTEPPITGMLIQSDEGGEIPADLAQWMYSVTEQESVPIANDFLIDSGAATSVFSAECGRHLVGFRSHTSCTVQAGRNPVQMASGPRSDVQVSKLSDVMNTLLLCQAPSNRLRRCAKDQTIKTLIHQWIKEA